jgi:hypothetical protein
VRIDENDTAEDVAADEQLGQPPPQAQVVADVELAPVVPEADCRARTPVREGDSLAGFSRADVSCISGS